MKCEECKYHSVDGYTHFCDSRKGKRKTVRISKEDAEKDIDCVWADEEEDYKYEHAIENLEHDILYEPTFNLEDGSM